MDNAAYQLLGLWHLIEQSYLLLLLCIESIARVRLVGWILLTGFQGIFVMRWATSKSLLTTLI